MKMLDLFAGIGGFSLAGHWLGWETVGFVEWDKYNQKVLTKNFPGIPIHSDITDYHGTLYAADIITGGFPCQPFSTAGKREGTNDSRYLWPEMLRIVREVQPVAVVGENVAGIYSMDNGRVFEQVCTDLENEGYSVQPVCIPACATGAPHRRDRWWFVAYSPEKDAARIEREQSKRQVPESGGSAESIAVAHATGKQKHATAEGGFQSEFGGSGCGTAADPRKTGLERGELHGAPDTGNAWKQALGSAAELHQGGYSWLQVATRLCRMDDGLPAWVDRHRANRLKSLGNSIQPQVSYEILSAINEQLLQ